MSTDRSVALDEDAPHDVAEPSQREGGALPAEDLFASVTGQRHAVEQLRSSARRPVHAYLLVGPPGLFQQQIARAFAAALLCRLGGCASCDVCRRALAGTHPDLVEIERTGASITVDDARRVVRLAQRRPLEGHRQVVVISELHLARLAAPVLLKTLEEPAEQTFFVLMSDSVPAELATVASRCIRVDLRPLAVDEIAGLLESRGLEPGRALEVAEASVGSPERALLLAGDDGVAARRELWRSVPARLDGTGASAAMLAAELMGACEGAVAPLRLRHAEELEQLSRDAEASGARGVSGRKALEERHNREERRWRMDELRSGLAVLCGAYRDRLAQLVAALSSSSSHDEERLRALSSAIASVDSVVPELVRNPNETLLLEALLVRLSSVPA